MRRLDAVHIGYALAIADWCSIVFVVDAQRGLVALGVPGGAAWALASLALALVVGSSVAAFVAEGRVARIVLPLAFLGVLGGYTALVVAGRGSPPRHEALPCAPCTASWAARSTGSTGDD